MVFWHNQRYEKLEKICTGDPLKQLPEHKFPWLLLNFTFLDLDGDTWIVEVSCTNINPYKSSNKVKADFILEAQAKVSSENLKKMEISSRRLDMMGVHSWNKLEESLQTSAVLEFDRIELKAKEVAGKIIEDIKNKYSLKLKAQMLLSKIKLSPISGFSMSD
ncbi:hypothetical protein [Fluviispira multicolorata]|uniref:Uncharacterized protein n=1 Tax=Fluviispira multicolorata TaxID=2654512 RepID=A0A833JF03_9BACT|nr:hypothetical protein [Fluviispira multicolorata]KAB8032179.1 hypothetical protein GCL57_05910 [Fluviispira multicolorata]